VIHVEDDPMGMGGTAWHLTQPADLAKLPAEPLRLVSSRLTTIFRAFPDSVIALAEEAPLPSMAKWLRSLADAKCQLEVHRTAHFDNGARLRFHFSDIWTPSFSAKGGRLPADVPALLHEVHRLVGDVDYQFGCSGTLVPPKTMLTVTELVRKKYVLNADLVDEGLLVRPALARYRGFFEADGDWLCTNARGSTVWLGGEWLGDSPQEGERLPVVLERYFATLCEQKYFHA
jgi:hypothetical protein